MVPNNKPIEAWPGPGRAAAIQVVDPAVSKIKFEQETDQFLKGKVSQQKRGIIVLDCQFPNVKLAYCMPGLKPAPIVFAVNINFTNYDLHPLSVKFIDPFDYRFLSKQDVGPPFLRRVGDSGTPNDFISLVIGLPDATSFVCLPGIREYHQHTDHSNDPWLTHRGRGGEGTLGFIVDKLFQFGVSGLNGYSVQLNYTQIPLSIDLNKVPR